MASYIEPLSDYLNVPLTKVIPEQAGVQNIPKILDYGLRQNDAGRELIRFEIFSTYCISLTLPVPILAGSF